MSALFKDRNLLLGCLRGEAGRSMLYVGTNVGSVDTSLNVSLFNKKPQVGDLFFDKMGHLFEVVAVTVTALATCKYLTTLAGAVGGGGGGSAVIDSTLTVSGAAADAKATGDRLAAVEKALADLSYVAISILNFTASPSIAEKGATVDRVLLSWGVNQTPKTQTLDGTSLAVTDRSKTLTGLSLKDNKMYTLKVTDDKDGDEKSVTVYFYNGVYYGVAEEPEEYESAFILGLTKSLQTTRAKTIDVTAGAGEYIYYCIPSSYGECTFTDVASGFGAGLEKVKTINFTNAYGYTENYDIYKSEYDGLGKCSIKVS